MDCNPNSQFMSGLLLGGMVGWIIRDLLWKPVQVLLRVAVVPKEEVHDLQLEHFPSQDRSVEILQVSFDRGQDSPASEPEDRGQSLPVQTSPVKPEVKPEVEKASTSPEPSTEVQDATEQTDQSRTFAQMFEEEATLRNRKRKEVLDKGRKLGPAPVMYFQGRGGGYATNEQIKAERQKYEKHHLTRAEEAEIIAQFKPLEGQSLSDARQALQKEGYKLHVLCDSRGEWRKLSAYDPTVLGVKTNDGQTLSVIIDVGGVDRYYRGASM